MTTDRHPLTTDRHPFRTDWTSTACPGSTADPATNQAARLCVYIASGLPCLTKVLLPAIDTDYNAGRSSLPPRPSIPSSLANCCRTSTDWERRSVLHYRHTHHHTHHTHTRRAHGTLSHSHPHSLARLRGLLSHCCYNSDNIISRGSRQCRGFISPGVCSPCRRRNPQSVS